MSIRHVLRLPETHWILPAAQGARGGGLPAAFTWTMTRTTGKTLVRARAIENQMF